MRGLAFHLVEAGRDPVRVAASFAIAKAMHHAPDFLRTVEDLAASAEDVRSRLRAWWSTGGGSLDHDVDYFKGPYTFHGLLERTAWHVATHLRQLGSILVGVGIQSAAELATEDVRGLPIPPALWK